jgi:hypothetical protein
MMMVEKEMRRVFVRAPAQVSTTSATLGKLDIP